MPNVKRLLPAILALLILLSAAACSATSPSATFTPLQPPTLTPTTIPTTPTPTAISPESVSELNTTLENLAQQGLFTGSVLIAQQVKVLLSQGYGMADRVQKIPNTPQTRFRLGSITKQFTVMAILILESQGKLNVKNPICNYIPDCPSTWEAITIKHLLTHTSGIPDFFSVVNWPGIRATPSAPVQTIAWFKDKPLDFQPGEGWSYSNSGYIVLGYIIEQVSGQTYEDFLQRSIFTPLNLHDTGYDHNSNGLAVGYPDRYSTQTTDFVDMSIPYAAGGLYSTVEDLYRWDQALSTEQLVPKVYLDEMFAPQAVIPNGDGAAYGYGWGIWRENGRLINMHSGGIEGFTTLIVRYPNDHVTIIVLSNQQDTTVGTIGQILSRKIFGDQ